MCSSLLLGGNMSNFGRCMVSILSLLPARKQISILPYIPHMSIATNPQTRIVHKIPIQITVMSITTSPQTRIVHKIPTQITVMSITTSPQTRIVHKISTQITVITIMQLTVPCPQALNLKKLSTLLGSLMLRV